MSTIEKKKKKTVKTKFPLFLLAMPQSSKIKKQVTIERV